MQIVQAQLPNKLNYLFIPEKHSKSVAIVFLVKVGSRYESETQSGISHFIEHMMFKGTSSRPSSMELSLEIEKIGGYANAFTSYEYTGYYIKVPHDQAQKALELIVDIYQNSIFPDDQVTKEGQVICEEIKMYDDLPNQKVKNIFNNLLFGDNSLGREIAGTLETVASIKKGDLLTFKENHYQPKNLNIIIAGNFDQQLAQAKLVEFFSNQSNLKQSAKEAFTKPANENKIIKTFYYKETKQTHIVIGGFGYDWNYDKRYAYKVGNSMLGEGLGSMLFQLVREKLGAAYYVYSSLTEYHDTGKYTINLGIDPNRVEEVIEAVLIELSNLKSGNFSNQVLERAQNYLIGNIITGLESTEDLAEWYGMNLLKFDKIEQIDDTIKQIKLVSKEDIVESWYGITTDKSTYIATLGENDITFADR